MKTIQVHDSILHMDYSKVEARVIAHIFENCEHTRYMTPAKPEPITLICEDCGKTDKRPAVDPYTGHAYGTTFTYRCMNCGGEMELIEELEIE